MKCVICCINSKYIHSSLAPWYLAAGVREYGENVTAKVIEGTVNEQHNAVLEGIIKETPDAVSFCCYIWNIDYVKTLCREIKKDGITVILGGPEVSFCNEEMYLQNPDADYILCGEGEESLPKLLNSLAKGEKPVRDDTYHIAKRLLNPYCDEYFRSLGGRISYIESSRGCPYHCAFCLSGADGGLRYFDMDEVKENILLLARSGCKTVKFVDRTFNANKKRSLEILRFISKNFGKSEKNDICFHFEIAADILDDEWLDVVKGLPTGLVQFEAGIQSFNLQTLDAVHRKNDLEKIKAGVKKLLCMKNCHIHTDLIAGLPYEDLDSFARSFNQAYELKSQMLQLGFLKLLYGSELRSTAGVYEMEYSANAPYEVTKTKWMSEEDFTVLKGVEDALERVYNSGRFLLTAQYVLEKSGLTAFEFYRSIAKAMSLPAYKMKLDCFTQALYGFLKTVSGVDETELRDKMLTDRLLTNNNGILPECLKRNDKRLTVIKAKMREKYGNNIGVGILYGTNEILCVMYAEKDKVSGWYPSVIIKNEEIKKLRIIR